MPIRNVRIVRREQKQDLGLQGIGVLELIDEEMREAALQIPPDSIVIAHEITRFDEEVEEIEATGLRLQKLVVGDRRLQRLMEKRGEIGFARGDEGFQISTHAVAAGQYFGACHLVERRLR